VLGNDKEYAGVLEGTPINSSGFYVPLVQDGNCAVLPYLYQQRYA
jgi:hypothetical protein